MSFQAGGVLSLGMEIHVGAPSKFGLSVILFSISLLNATSSEQAIKQTAALLACIVAELLESA
eukprot:614944-Pyramimonas_sp.AAC.1